MKTKLGWGDVILQEIFLKKEFDLFCLKSCFNLSATLSFSCS